jgi:hypothetical protein
MAVRSTAWNLASNRPLKVFLTLVPVDIEILFIDKLVFMY